MPSLLFRPRVVLTACAAVILGLLAVAAFAPLPVSIVTPGPTADVLGANNGLQVITIKGTPVRRTTGQLRLLTVTATAPNASVHFSDVWRAWWKNDQAAMPRGSVYPGGGSVQHITRVNQQQMVQSQQAATAAALKHLHLSPAQVNVTLQLADVGGPSAGMLFTLGIIDKVAGNGHGGDLTGGRIIAGTGTIDPSGKVGAVGGVPLKELSARRAGATVFLVPRGECADAKAQLPGGMTLIPVQTLDGALSALDALNAGRVTPRC